MIDERIMPRFDKMRMEGKAEGKAESRAEVARNLLKEGIGTDVIARATGLSIADIEKQSKTASTVSPARGD
jgi:predicted transposase/invertase (TIGR01784 family)